MQSHSSLLFFYPHRFNWISRSTHTTNYVIILPLMYLHPELLTFLYLAFWSTYFPHLVTIRLDLALTKSKYPYFSALMDLSYLTYCGTTSCSPYSWQTYTFVYLLITSLYWSITSYSLNRILQNSLFVYLTRDSFYLPTCDVMSLFLSGQIVWFFHLTFLLPIMLRISFLLQPF